MAVSEMSRVLHGFCLLLLFGMVTQSLNDIATQPFTYFLSPFLSTGSGPLVLGP